MNKLPNLRYNEINKNIRTLIRCNKKIIRNKGIKGDIIKEFNNKIPKIGITNEKIQKFNKKSLRNEIGENEVFSKWVSYKRDKGDSDMEREVLIIEEESKKYDKEYVVKGIEDNIIRDIKKIINKRDIEIGIEIKEEEGMIISDKMIINKILKSECINIEIDSIIRDINKLKSSSVNTDYIIRIIAEKLIKSGDGNGAIKVLRNGHVSIR